MDVHSESGPPLRLHRPPRSSLTIRWGRDAASPALPPIAESSPAEAPALAATDPRWVLAVRTSQVMQGDVIGPDDREQLIRVGRLLGLNAFESNLVIAIVQDQARRGQGLDAASTALHFVPIHQVRQRLQQRRWRWRVAIWSLAAVALELAILAWLM